MKPRGLVFAAAMVVCTAPPTITFSQVSLHGNCLTICLKTCTTSCAPARQMRRPAAVRPNPIRPRGTAVVRTPSSVQSRPAMSAPQRSSVGAVPPTGAPAAGASQQTNFTAPREYPKLSSPPTLSIGAMPHPPPTPMPMSKGVTPAPGSTAAAMPHPAPTPMLKPAAMDAVVNRDSMQPASANAGTGASGTPAFCDSLTGKCTPAPSVAPSTPPSQTGSSSCGPLAPGATAVPECSAPPPGATTVHGASLGPTTTFNGVGGFACHGYNSAHQIVPTDCSTPGVFIYPNSPLGPTSSTAPQVTGTDAPSQPPSPSSASTTQQPASNYSRPSQPPSQNLDPEKISLKQMEATIQKCSDPNRLCGECPLPQVTPYRYCGGKPKPHSVCGVDPGDTRDTTFADCYVPCIKTANAYYAIAQKCEQSAILHNRP
jgi:hypothetical protein